MRVYMPTPLRSYTGQQADVEAEGATVGELLADLDRRYPGIRFRMIDEQDAIRLLRDCRGSADLQRLRSHRKKPIISALISARRSCCTPWPRPGSTTQTSPNFPGSVPFSMNMSCGII